MTSKDKFRSRLSNICLIAIASSLAACADNPTEPGKSVPTFSASIAGAAWIADTTVTAVQPQPGEYTISGRSKADANFQVDLSLYGIKATGKYPLGTIPNISGGYVQISGAPGGHYVSPTSGSAGEVEITALSGTRIAGNFSVTAVGGTGNTTLAITNGTFNLPLTGMSPGPVLDSAGGSFRGTVDGETFSAAGATAYLPSVRADRLALYAFNDAPYIKSTELYVLLEHITTAGTYALDVSALRYMSVTQARTTPSIPLRPPFVDTVGSWHSQNTGSSGTVTITGLSATRIVGTLTATLVPNSDSRTARPITVTAQFDLGRRSLLSSPANTFGLLPAGSLFLGHSAQGASQKFVPPLLKLLH